MINLKILYATGLQLCMETRLNDLFRYPVELRNATITQGSDIFANPSRARDPFKLFCIRCCFL